MRNRNAKTVLSRAIAVFGLLFLSLSFVVSPARAQTGDSRSGDAQTPDQSTDPASAQAAQLAAVVTGATEDDIARISDSLVEVDGVTSVVADSSADSALVYFLWVDDNLIDTDHLESLGAQVSETVGEISPQAEVQIGGELLSEKQIRNRFSRTSLFIGIAGVVACALAAVIFGWRRGLVAAATLVLAIGVASEFGGQIAGSFDGTMASTSLPAVLVGSVAAFVAAIRILAWSNRPLVGSASSKVRSAIFELGPEVALIVASLVILSGVAELLQSGRSAFTVAAVGAGSASLTVFSLLPVGLVLLQKFAATEADGNASSAANVVESSAVGGVESYLDSPRTASQLPFAVPDGADQPLLFLVAGAVCLMALSVFAFGNPDRQFLGPDSLPSATDEASVGELLAIVGDQTAPIRASFEKSTASEVVDQWAMDAAELPEVVRVETSSGTFGRGGSLAEEKSFPDAAFTGSQPVALVVPAAVSRSETAQELVRELAGLELSSGTARLSGPSVNAAAGGPSRTDLLVLVVVAAALVGFGVAISAQSRAYGLTAGLLRLLFGAASVGLYRLVVPGATGAELAVVLAVTTTVAALLDFEFLERVSVRESERSGAFLFKNPGETSLVGIGFLGLACVMMLLGATFGGGPTAGRLGFGLLFAALLEGTIGGFVSRPALLGQRGAFHSFARPLRVALANSSRSAGSDEVEGDPQWKRVVSDLLHSEYQLLADPSVADVSQVFLTDTPLARQATEKVDSLRRAGLRITSRGPKLVRVTTRHSHAPISLGVTVEHSARQLVGPGGTVVGTRVAELKRGVLWLIEGPDGSYRIAESVELESAALDRTAPDLSFSSDSISLPADEIGHPGVDLASETEASIIVMSDEETELVLAETTGSPQKKTLARPGTARPGED